MQQKKQLSQNSRFF